MRTAILTRLYSKDEGTFGTFEVDSGYSCFSIELPWRDNIMGKSCIPAGKYSCSWRYSQKHGYCYHVENVPGRTDIEIHAANWAGDTDKGFKSQLLGCIALGFSIIPIEGQLGVSNSRGAIAELEDSIGPVAFDLEILYSQPVKGV